VYVLGGLLAIDQRDDVWMVQAFEDSDLGGEVVFELFVELRKVDRLDCHKAFLFLLVLTAVSNMLLPETTPTVLGRIHRCFLQRGLAGLDL
jgi:hypothetical protein